MVKSQKIMQISCIFVLVIMLLMPVSQVTVLAESQETKYEFEFANEYAVVGEKLEVNVDGKTITNIDNKFMFKWYIDNEIIENDKCYYIPDSDDICKIVRVDMYIVDTVNVDSDPAGSCSMLIDEIPVMYINTEGGADIISKTDYVNAYMQLQGNKNHNASSELYTGSIQIRGRGNSTWLKDKKPYKIKLDSKNALLGMDKSKHWVLLANYYDESLMRNKLAYDLSGKLGMPYMKSTWVDVVLNGSYIGNYQLCEQVRVDGSGVDIYDWEKTASNIAKGITKTQGLTTVENNELETSLQEDYNWVTSGQIKYNDKYYNVSDYVRLPDISGGYLIEVDLYYASEFSRFSTRLDKRAFINSPEYIKTNPVMFNYIKQYLQAFEDACTSDNYLTEYNGKTVHYSDLADMNSMIDYWIVQDLIFANCEIECKSTYLYKDIGGLLYFGPVWDMDYSSNSFQNQVAVSKLFGNNIDKIGDSYFPKWYPRLLTDPYFVVKAQERISEVLSQYVTPMCINNGIISQYDNYLKSSGLSNTAKWKYRRGYEGDVSALTTWFQNRVAWIKNNFSDDSKSIETLGVYKKSDSISINVTDKKENTKILNNSLITDNTNAYIVDTDKFYINVIDSAKEDTELELYINGKLHSTEPYSNGLVQFDIDTGSLTEKTGTKNVAVIRTKKATGEYTGSNYITIVTNDVVTPSPPTSSPPPLPPTSSPLTPLPPPTLPPTPLPTETVTPFVLESEKPVQTVSPLHAEPHAVTSSLNTQPSQITYLVADSDIKRGSVIYDIVSSNKRSVKVKGVTDKKIKSIVIPSYILINGTKYSVVSIQAFAMKGCKRLKKVVVGSKVSSIGAKAFMNCKSLRNIYIKSCSLTKIDKSSFKGMNRRTVIRVRSSKFALYKKRFLSISDRMKRM